jgi:hypothetical protein
MKALRRTFGYLRWQHWGAALAIGILIGILMPLETIHINPHRIAFRIAYGTLWCMAFACIFLVAIGLVESASVNNRPSINRYLFAALAASLFCVALTAAFPTKQHPIRYVPGSSDTSPVYTAAHRRPSSIFALGFDGVVHCWIAMFVYVRLRNARLAARELARTQLHSAQANRRVVEARLATVRSQVDPGLLSLALEEIEDAYGQDSALAEEKLDELIDFLRAAIPHVRDDDRIGTSSEIALSNSGVGA